MEYAETRKPNRPKVEKLEDASLHFPSKSHDPKVMDGDQNQ